MSPIHVAHGARVYQTIFDAIVNPFLLVYAGLFPIVNPLGSAPMFLSLTRGWSPEVRHALAGRVAVNGFLLLLGSLFVGSHILGFFGITLPIVRIAGGFVVSAMGWQLLKEGENTADRSQMPTRDDDRALEAAFYPLTMPLTVGPGSISTAIALGSQRPLHPAGPGQLAILAGAAVAGLAAIALTIYISYRFADAVERLLGRSGTNVFVRLSAFILLCIGVQIMWNGFTALQTGQ
jgi:multiple antibiotic resistance protein